MPRYQNQRARRSAAQAEPAVKADTNEFQAPTIGLEDKIFTIGTTTDAAKFEVVKEELGKHFATQAWSDEANTAIAFDTLTEPSYHEPEEPEFPLKMMDGDGDQKVEDPEYEAKLIRYRVLCSKYARCDDEYAKLVKSWKNNRSRMFAIVLQHCPPDLVQRLKSKDLWTPTFAKRDVIGLPKMIGGVAHAHDDTTQCTMAIVASDMTMYTTYMDLSN